MVVKFRKFQIKICIETDFKTFFSEKGINIILKHVSLSSCYLTFPYFFRKEIQAIFEKYQKNKVRRLHKPDALKMLENEFNLTEDQASQMFETFDKDMNGDMSLWEFQQFYETVGTG